MILWLALLGAPSLAAEVPDRSLARVVQPDDDEVPDQLPDAVPTFDRHWQDKDRRGRHTYRWGAAMGATGCASMVTSLAIGAGRGGEPFAVVGALLLWSGAPVMASGANQSQTALAGVAGQPRDRLLGIASWAMWGGYWLSMGVSVYTLETGQDASIPLVVALGALASSYAFAILQADQNAGLRNRLRVRDPNRRVRIDGVGPFTASTNGRDLDVLGVAISGSW